MSFLIYFVVALVTLFSVLFEMNVLVEPPRKIEHAAVKQTPPAAQNKIVVPATDARANEPAPAANQTAAILQPQAAAGKCDVAACAATYHSFRASDCTYQPDVGPRQLCDKGVPSDPATAAAVLNAHADAGGANASPAQCNVSACEQAYVSFNRADCTYQPFEGPRQLCKK
jgi:hypothetical protein